MRSTDPCSPQFTSRLPLSSKRGLLGPSEIPRGRWIAAAPGLVESPRVFCRARVVVRSRLARPRLAPWPPTGSNTTPEPVARLERKGPAVVLPACGPSPPVRGQQGGSVISAKRFSRSRRVGVDPRACGAFVDEGTRRGSQEGPFRRVRVWLPVEPLRAHAVTVHRRGPLGCFQPYPEPVGPPPRMRGTRRGDSIRSTQCGPLPERAGRPIMLSMSARWPQVHPRTVRGVWSGRCQAARPRRPIALGCGVDWPTGAFLRRRIGVRARVAVPCTGHQLFAVSSGIG